MSNIFEILLDYPILIIIGILVLRKIFSKKEDKKNKNQRGNVLPNNSLQSKPNTVNDSRQGITLQELLAGKVPNSGSQTQTEQPQKKKKAQSQKKAQQKKNMPSEYDFKPVGSMKIDSEFDKNYDTSSIDYDVVAADYDQSGLDYDKNASAFDFRNPINEPEAMEYHQGDYGFHQIHGLTQADRKLAEEEMKAYEDKQVMSADLSWIFNKDNINQFIIASEVFAKPKGLKR